MSFERGAEDVPSRPGTPWFDVGQLVGIWYLAVTLRSWRSLGWAREHAQLASGSGMAVR